MSFLALLYCQALLAQAHAGGIEPGHAQNTIYDAVRTVGLKAEGAVAQLSEPLLRDGMSGEEQQAILLKLLDSTKALEDFLAPGISSPIKSKLHDWPGTTGTIRGFDIWFVVHAKLDEMNSDDFSRPSDKGANADSGGMHFEGDLLDADELKKLGLTLSGKMDRVDQIECALLDKVEAKMLNRSLGTRSDGSLVVATQTVLTLPANEAQRNAWRAVDRRAAKISYGPWQPYAGIIAYTKTSRLDFRPGALLVEIHGAFTEPKGWFNGKAILKSKITIVANEKIRDLRREIAKKREKAAGPAS
ncbi:MAG: hypothetical protein ACLQIB_46585 [Isosphaeraceae bacterium]